MLDLTIKKNVRAILNHLNGIAPNLYADIISAGLKCDFRYQVAVLKQINFEEMYELGLFATHSDTIAKITFLLSQIIGNYKDYEEALAEHPPIKNLLENVDNTDNPLILSHFRNIVISLCKKRIPEMENWDSKPDINTNPKFDDRIKKQEFYKEIETIIHADDNSYFIKLFKEDVNVMNAILAWLEIFNWINSTNIKITFINVE